MTHAAHPPPPAGQTASADEQQLGAELTRQLHPQRRCPQGFASLNPIIGIAIIGLTGRVSMADGKGCVDSIDASSTPHADRLYLPSL